MFVGPKNGSSGEWCRAYCPIDPRAKVQFHPFGYGDVIQDLGKTEWHGQEAELYYWKDVGPAGIELNSVHMYANITDPMNAIPLMRSTDITPLGIKSAGTMNLTWTNLKQGAPDPSKFDIQGVDACPVSTESQNITHRLASAALGH